MTTTQGNSTDEQEPRHNPRGLSWRSMLAIVALAILVASAVAYLLVDPYFHQPAR